MDKPYVDFQHFCHIINTFCNISGKEGHEFGTFFFGFIQEDPSKSDCL